MRHRPSALLPLAIALVAQGGLGALRAEERIESRAIATPLLVGSRNPLLAVGIELTSRGA